MSEDTLATSAVAHELSRPDGSIRSLKSGEYTPGPSSIYRAATALASSRDRTLGADYCGRGGQRTRCSDDVIPCDRAFRPDTLGPPSYAAANPHIHPRQGNPMRCASVHLRQ